MTDYNHFATMYSSSVNNKSVAMLSSISAAYKEECDGESPPAKIANISGKYPIVHENGHRRYGPPNDWQGDIPSRGCEVFIGKIPRDCGEDELIPIFETVGEIFEFRLMVDFNNVNRGYAFCVYHSRDDANKAVEKLNNYEIRPGKSIGVCFSVDNCRLFVGGIPKNKSKEEIFTEMQRVTSGVVNVIAYPSIANKNKNRGFAFVEYESHKAAAVARRKLIPGKIPLWGQQIAVDWAEPEREVHESIMANVKILYARNLMLTTTEDTLREKFLLASGGPANCIERVKKMKDYAFIHFTDRCYAEKAKDFLNNSNVDGSIIEVSWAKPADKSQAKTNKVQPNLSDLSLGDLQNATQIYYDPNTGLSYLGPAMGSWANSLNVIGDSNIRSKQIRRNAAGTRSASGLKDKKQSIEYLEELATTYNWGTPQYSTSSTEIDRNGVKSSLYTGQVFLPNLNVKQVTQVLHSSPEEAKAAAAELFVKSVTQPPTVNNLDIRQQLAVFQALNQIPLTALISPQTGALNATQPSALDINSVAAAGASLYYLQPGLTNSTLFHPASVLNPPPSNISTYGHLFQPASTSISSIVNSSAQTVNNNIFPPNNGLNLLSSPTSISMLLDPTNLEQLDSSQMRNALIANQQQSFLFNGSQPMTTDPSSLLVGCQVPNQ